MNEKTSYAFIVNNITEANRLPSICSVFTAELYAIYKAIEYIENSNWNKAVIFSDSLSTLQTIQSGKLKCHYMFKLQKLLSLTNKEIILEWVPAHTGIEGNEKADQAAKATIDNINIREITLHYYDYKSLLSYYRENKQNGNKLTASYKD